MSSQIQVRAFRESDRETLRALFQESRRVAFFWQPPESFQLADFDRSTEGERIWVAEQDGQIVGFASVWEPDNFLHSLFVAPQCLRQGIGTALLATALVHLGRPATLKCQQRNERAFAFYQQHGWTIAGTGESPEGNYNLLKYDEGRDST